MWQVCQSKVSCIRRLSGMSEGCQKGVRRSPCVSEGHQVYKKLIRCVRRLSGVSEGYQVCQNIIRNVRRLSGMSEGCQLCQKVVRCVKVSRCDRRP